MMSDKDDPTSASDELHQLLRQNNQAEHKKPEAKTTTSTASEDITINKELLKLNLTNTNTVQNAAPIADNTQPSNDTKIEAILGDQIKAQLAKQTASSQKKASASHEPSLSDMLSNPEQLIQTSYTPGKSITQPLKSDENSNFHQLQRKLASGKIEQKKDKVSGDWTKFRAPAIALGIVILFGSIFFWVHHQKHHLDSQNVLYKLAKNAKQFQKQYQFLPGTLAEFDDFPDEAIEWPVKYWAAHNVEGRPEIIWLPYENGRFTIVLRKPEGTWYYDSITNKVTKNTE